MYPLILTSDHICPESPQTYTKLTDAEIDALKLDVHKAGFFTAPGKRNIRQLHRDLRIEARYRGLSYGTFKRLLKRFLQSADEDSWDELFDSVVLPFLHLDGYGLLWPDEVIKKFSD